jgi:hypothetical protein
MGAGIIPASLPENMTFADVTYIVSFVEIVLSTLKVIASALLLHR